MAFRKLDNARHALSLFPPVSWKEKTLALTPFVDEHGFVSTSVAFPDVDCKVRSDSQLSPDEVNLDLIVKTGQVIDPSKAMKIFQQTDIADKEEWRDEFSNDMVQFLTEHVDELKQLNNK